MLPYLSELAALSTLAVASLHDVRSRMVPDWVWLPGSILGIAIKLLDPGGTLQFILRYWPFLLLLSLMLIMEWFLSLSGQADVLAYLTLSLLLTGNCTFPDALLVYLLSKVLIALMIPCQFLVNSFRIIGNRGLMDGFDEPLWRKILAMMLLSPYDRRIARCASTAEVSVDGRRRFVLRAALRISCDDPPEEGKWIAPAYPAMPFIFAATLLVISPLGMTLKC